jgi:REP element-mobilizing transposase RayT
MPSENAQLAFPAPRTWGGRRDGAGRKPSLERRNVVHRTRPLHLARHPAHVTLRRAAQVSSLRNRRSFLAARSAISKCTKSSFRVIHFSVQRDHIHLIVEGSDRLAIARGIQGLCVRIARAVNKHLVRKGQVFGDRYHRRDLATPKEVKNAIAYVLLNGRKHNPTTAVYVDYFSSGGWFDGWRVCVKVPKDPSPVAQPRTWLAQVGWRRHGPVENRARRAWGNS